MKLVEIGTPLIKKGFRLTPVHPLTKMGVFRNWGNHQATTVEKLQEYACTADGKYAERGDPWKSVNLNVKDMNETDGEGKHPTLYDVKGIGGGSLVVGAGSVRESGEVYKAMDDDAEVLPIPDWLVDWIVADVTK